jgi:hypothetical protein
MKQLVGSRAVRIRALIQNACANVDFEIVSLPGGSFIAVFLSLYAITMGYIRRAATTNYLIHDPCARRSNHLSSSKVSRQEAAKG